MSISEVLKRSEIFLALNDSDLGKISALPSCRQETFLEGETIFNSGDSAREIYVLKEGHVNLVTELSAEGGGTATVIVDSITTGDFFGWSSMVGPHQRVFTATCKRPSEVIIVDARELMALFEEDYRIGYRFFMSLSSIIGTRLRYMEQALLKGKRWPFLEKKRSSTGG